MCQWVHSSDRVPLPCIRTRIPDRMKFMGSITVCKLNHAGCLVISYTAEVLQRNQHVVTLRAVWDRARSPLDLGYVRFEPCDCFTEYFYADCWYNIFEIRAADGRLKGWYCNVTRPPCISEDEIAAEDLALDLWVAPDGTMQVLDEDEFAALPLTLAEREAAYAALAELQALAMRRAPPFDRRGERE